MKTIYCSIDARRLTVSAPAAGQRASGGEETVCYAFVPARTGHDQTRRDKVVDFPGSWNGGARRAGRPMPESPAPVEHPGRKSAERRWQRLELCATLAVIGAALAIAVRFFTL